MTILGVVVGGYVTGEISSRLVIGTGAGASLAMGISGFFGAYMTEKAERIHKLKKLHRAMLVDVSDTVHGKASTAAALWAALVDGISPALTATIGMIPFILSYMGTISVIAAMQASVVLIIMTLFALGAFLGKVSEENVLAWGLRLVLVAIFTIGIIFALGGPHG